VNELIQLLRRSMNFESPSVLVLFDRLRYSPELEGPFIVATFPISLLQYTLGRYLSLRFGSRFEIRGAGIRAALGLIAFSILTAASFLFWFGAVMWVGSLFHLLFKLGVSVIIHSSADQQQTNELLTSSLSFSPHSPSKSLISLS
jgi:hypothetical protein